MQIGINCIAPTSLPIIKTLKDEGKIDFCELVVDNFFQFNPNQIRSALDDLPIALHIVNSRFLEKSNIELKKMADFLKPWINQIKPIYVSDHLAQFRDEKKRRLPFALEINYEKKSAFWIEKINLWQSYLNQNIYFENHASLTNDGKAQKKFFETSQVNVLFDVSNAYIAHLNGIFEFNGWESIFKNAQHFHIAGFKKDSETGLVLDTHDSSLDEMVLTLASICFNQNNHNQTCVMEFTANQSKDEIITNLTQLKKSIHVQRSYPVNFSFNLSDRNEINLLTLKAWVKKLSAENNKIESFLRNYTALTDNIFMDFLQCLAEKESLTVNIQQKYLIKAAQSWLLSGLDHFDLDEKHFSFGNQAVLAKRSRDILKANVIQLSKGYS